MEATERPAADDFVSIMNALRSGAMDLDDAPEPFVEAFSAMTKRSREELKAGFRRDAEREANAPKAGMPAPDFELELLSPEGERTDLTRRLSAFRGKPVALAFGSYT